MGDTHTPISFEDRMRQRLAAAGQFLASHACPPGIDVVLLVNRTANLIMVKHSPNSDRLVTYRKSYKWIDQLKEAKTWLLQYGQEHPGTFDSVQIILVTSQEVTPQVVALFERRDIAVVSGKFDDELIERVFQRVMGQSDTQYLHASLLEAKTRLDAMEARAGETADERLRAVQRLAQYNTAEVVTTLTQLLRTDSDPRIRAEAAYGLGLHKVSEVISDLLEQSRDVEWFVREQCAWALGEIASSDDRSVIQRLEEMAHQDASARVREVADQSLSKLQGH